ncbi:hypothetical protein BCR34DRAFT_600522 [Clohesyomyces aquaticus]|uniref:Uncharacterized protein n=1 Tax=Clohesyomyces aquaticus TaxID=1231657 RepID=A0A1Y1ZRL6_9PLEO|nr:hypothetical protein BCR34DRAFT_600522 [Clohesyomyces aquaticus]
MKFTLVAILAAASFAVAENCQPGLSYCGYNLLRRGNYRQDMEAELEKRTRNMGYTERYVQQSVFYCKDSAGGIEYSMYCGDNNNCKDGGANKNDACNW